MRDLFYGLMLSCVCTITALVGLARLPQPDGPSRVVSVAATADVAEAESEPTASARGTSTQTGT